MERSPLLLDWEDHHSKNGNSIKSNLQIQCNPHQNPNKILHRPGENNNQVYMAKQKHPVQPKQSYTTKVIPEALPSLTSNSITELQ